MPLKKIAPFSYAVAQPDGYECGECGAKGVKLWREYNTFLEHQKLRCVACAKKDQKEEDLYTREDGCSWNKHVNDWNVTIGWLIPAVPTEDGDTFWGYTSTPGPAFRWWTALPLNVEKREEEVEEREDERLKKTEFLVEANSYEVLTLWKERENCRIKEWVQDSVGALADVGKIGDRPICVDMQWAEIDGKLVCFYHGCSRLVDSIMIDDWLEKEFPNKKMKTNAMNFGNVVAAIRGS